MTKWLNYCPPQHSKYVYFVSPLCSVIHCQINQSINQSSFISGMTEERRPRMHNKHNMHSNAQDNNSWTVEGPGRANCHGAHLSSRGPWTGSTSNCDYRTEERTIMTMNTMTRAICPTVKLLTEALMRNASDAALIVVRNRSTKKMRNLTTFACSPDTYVPRRTTTPHPTMPCVHTPPRNLISRPWGWRQVGLPFRLPFFVRLL